MENHHLYVALNVLAELQIYKNMSEQDYETFRKEIKSAILATDLAVYFRYKVKLLSICNAGEFRWRNEEHRGYLKAIMMTASDISGQCKPYLISTKITNKLYRKKRSKSFGVMTLSFAALWHAIFSKLYVVSGCHLVLRVRARCCILILNELKTDVITSKLTLLCDVANPLLLIFIVYTEEFYNQGDIEKELGQCPISIMDRLKMERMPEDQVQFITVIAIPCVDLLRRLLPNTETLYTGAWYKITFI